MYMLVGFLGDNSRYQPVCRTVGFLSFLVFQRAHMELVNRLISSINAASRLKSK